MDITKKVQKIVNRWYIRYLVSTELYMVEPWEKVVIHVLLVLIFSLFWYFNYAVIVNGISQLRGTAQTEELTATIQ